MQEADQVARFTTQCEKTWNVRFQQGNNPHINFMAHLWEPLKVCHKPVIVHLFSEVAGATNCVWMLALGFRKQCYEVRFKQTPKRCNAAFLLSEKITLPAWV